MSNYLENMQERSNNLIQLYPNIYYFDHQKIIFNDDARMAPTNPDFRLSDQN